MEEMSYEEFKKKHLIGNVELKGEGIVDILEELKESKTGFDFIFICKKCGSRDIIIEGEDGTDYGEYTGYDPGMNVIKCKSCGNAITIWK